MTHYQNWRRAALFQKPEYIPYSIMIHKANWMRYGRELEKVVLAHPQTWPTYQAGDWRKLAERPWDKKENPEGDYVDSWGCVWRTTQYGFVGTIIEHPLEDDAALAAFVPPPAESYNGGQDPVDFDEAAIRVAAAKKFGERPRGSLDHGYFLLRLEYLRGFENFMCDMMDPSDDFMRLYQAVHELNRTAVGNWIKAGVETIGLPEDLGAQDRSMIGPKCFRQWALPCYKELHGMAQRAGCITHFHMDGYVMDIADQINEIAPNIINPQDQANGVDNLAKEFKGRVCIDLDFDRQHALPFGTPGEIRELVEYEVKTLGSKDGGLMFKIEVRADVPPQNIDAVAGALEKYCRYWS